MVKNLKKSNKKAGKHLNKKARRVSNTKAPKENKRSTGQDKHKDKDSLEDITGDVSNKADFYVDDADEILYDEEGGKDDKGEEDNSLDEGSDLDFAEEDYIESDEELEEEEEGSQKDGAEETKKSKLTKEELKKLLKKSVEGTPYALTKMVIIFNKIINPSQRNESLDEDNVLNKQTVCSRVLKFCIKDLPEILSLKLSSISQHGVKEESVNSKTSTVKNIIRRYLGTLAKFLKSADFSMTNLVFKYIENIASLVLNFKHFIEIFLKIAIKAWASNGSTNINLSAFNLVKTLLAKTPQHFELALKLFYINYLEVAKAVNWRSIERIRKLQDQIVQILSYDLDKAYLVIFTFVRKSCLQLRATVVDKVHFIFTVLESCQHQVHLQLAVYQLACIMGAGSLSLL